MSPVVSLEQQLADSLALRECARKAGITEEQARTFVAHLAELPIAQVIRFGFSSRVVTERGQRAVMRKEAHRIAAVMKRRKS